MTAALTSPARGLLLACVLAVAPCDVMAQPIVPPCGPVLGQATRELSDLARFNLGPTGAGEGCGLAELVGVWSPFGLAVSRTGHLPQQLRLTVDLPRLEGGARYVAWVATPALDRIEVLGAVTPGERLTATVDWNKLIVVVSREEALPAEGAPRWSGPIVLLGRSRSALLQNLMGHSIFRRAEM